MPFDKKINTGFSILEVLITAAIIGVITAIVTFKYGSFNNLILLKNQSYQVALELRETQTRSLSAYGSGAEFRIPYGMYFAMSEPDQYILFRDTDQNGYYSVGEELETRTLDSRFQLKRLCNGTSEVCSSRDDLSVTFVRPNFDAIMRSTAPAPALALSNVVIEIETVSGSSMRGVSINAAGQITVE